MSKENKLPDPNKYPIHIAKSNIGYLCGDKMKYTPAPVKVIGNAKWHDKRPLCPECHAIHISHTGEALEWPPK